MDVLAGETLPFAVAIGVTLAIALLEALGLVFGAQLSALFDGLLPEGDVDAEADALGPLSHLLGWLCFGRVPALVVVVLLATSFGLIGFLEQAAIRRLFGFALDPLLASLPALLLALPVTRLAALGLARVLPREESDAVSHAEFIGRIATVFRGEARAGQPAEAKLVGLHGLTHYLLVEPEEDGQVFSEGSEVLIIARRGSVYRVITRLKPAPGQA